MTTIGKYIADNYNDVYKLAYKLSKGDKNTRDFIQDIFVELYEKQLEEEQIKFFLIKVFMNQFNSVNSPFFCKYKKNNDLKIQIEEIFEEEIKFQNFYNKQLTQNIEDEVIYKNEQDKISKKLDIVYSILNNKKLVNDFERKVYKLYWLEGYKKIEIAAHVNVGRKKVAQAINRVQKVIQENIFNK